MASRADVRARALALCTLLVPGCGSPVAEGGAWDPDDATTGAGDTAGSTGAPASTDDTAAPPAPETSESGEPPPPPFPDVPQDDCPRVRITVMPGNVLNVRDAPATTGAEVGELGPNTCLLYTSPSPRD